jgi:hypothetical protein
MGGDSSIVEIDETGPAKAKADFGHKNTVLSLVNRGTDQVRSFHFDSTRREDTIPIVEANIATETHVMTEKSVTYRKLGDHFAKHDAVLARGIRYTGRRTETKIDTNTIESYYSNFNRGMKERLPALRREALASLVTEFDFRYSNRSAFGVEDAERANRLAAGIVAKRLTYRSLTTKARFKRKPLG